MNPILQMEQPELGKTPNKTRGRKKKEQGVPVEEAEAPAGEDVSMEEQTHDQEQPKENTAPAVEPPPSEPPAALASSSGPPRKRPRFEKKPPAGVGKTPVA